MHESNSQKSFVANVGMFQPADSEFLSWHLPQGPGLVHPTLGTLERAAGISKRKDGLFVVLGQCYEDIIIIIYFSAYSKIINIYKNNISYYIYSYYIDFSHLQQNHVLNLVVEVCGLLFGPSKPVRKGSGLSLAFTCGNSLQEANHQHPPAMNHQ